MARRKRMVTALMLGIGSALGSALFVRRGQRPARRVDLYFQDGSMLSLAHDTPEGGRLLPLADEVLAAS